TSKAAAKIAAGQRGLAKVARPRPLPSLCASCRIARPPHPRRTARLRRKPNPRLGPSIYRHCRNNAYNEKSVTLPQPVSNPSFLQNMSGWGQEGAPERDGQMLTKLAISLVALSD